MKNKHYTLIGAMVCMMAFILAFAPLPEDVIRMTIMRHEDGKVTVYDTLVEVSGGYTIEQYILSKGFDPGETEIIHASKVAHRIATSDDGTEDVYEHSTNIMVMENVENINGEENIVTITKVIDANGNSTIEKKVNGEIVSYDGDPNEDFHIQKIALPSGQTIEFDQDIEVIIENAIDNYNSDTAENDVMVYEFKTINDDGDDEEVRVKKFIYSSSSSEGNQDNVKTFKFSMITADGLSDPIIITPSNLTGTKTFAIVTDEDERPSLRDDDPDSGVTGVSENLKLPIEDLSFFPNPSDGQLTLQFSLPQRGQTEIAVYDLAGKEVYASSLGNFQGRYNEQLNFTNLEPGMYIMRISQNNLSLAEKLIIN